MAPLTFRHTIGADAGVLGKALGASAFFVVWGLGMFVGPVSPLLLLWAVVKLHWLIGLAAAALMAYPYCVPASSLYSPAWCCYVLKMANWLRGGASLWIADDVMKLAESDGIICCFHPHGMIPNGFTLNGAVRGRSQRAENIPEFKGFDARCSGVQAPVLFKVPLLRHILLGFGCCVPATKSGLRRLLNERRVFGIIPGGSEEVAIHQNGRENLYLKKRAVASPPCRTCEPSLGPSRLPPPSHAPTPPPTDHNCLSLEFGRDSSSTRCSTAISS